MVRLFRRFVDALVRWAFPGWVALALCSCAGSFEEARSAPRVSAAAKAAGDDLQTYCRGLDSEHRNWGAAAKFTGALAGVSALGAMLGPDDQEWQWAFAGGGLLMGGATAYGVSKSEGAAETWARDCAAR